MDWKKIADKAAETIDKRGGPRSVEEDAQELREIAEGEGTLAEKLKRAAAAVKEPGAHHDPGPPPPGAPPAPPAGDPTTTPDGGNV